MDESIPRSSAASPDPFSDALVLDARSLRGIAHPLRWRILTLLQRRGPLTGKAVSEALGITSASASYHLRQLHTYGFLTEDPDLGTSRERWWKAPHPGIRLPERLDTEAPELATATRAAMALMWGERLSAAVDAWASQPEEWREAQGMSDRLAQLTAEETDALREELRLVLDRYARRPGPEADTEAPGSRVVQVQLALFPSPRPDDRRPHEDGADNGDSGGGDQ